VPRDLFVTTIDRINEIFADAEGLNRANAVESLLGYFSCYLTYAFMESHYEKVRRTRRRAQCLQG